MKKLLPIPEWFFPALIFGVLAIRSPFAAIVLAILFGADMIARAIRGRP